MNCKSFALIFCFTAVPLFCNAGEITTRVHRLTEQRFGPVSMDALFLLQDAPMFEKAEAAKEGFSYLEMAEIEARASDAKFSNPALFEAEIKKEAARMGANAYSLGGVKVFKDTDKISTVFGKAYRIERNGKLPKYLSLGFHNAAVIMGHEEELARRQIVWNLPYNKLREKAVSKVWDGFCSYNKGKAVNLAGAVIDVKKEGLTDIERQELLKVLCSTAPRRAAAKAVVPHPNMNREKMKAVVRKLMAKYIKPALIKLREENQATYRPYRDLHKDIFGGLPLEDPNYKEKVVPGKSQK